MLDHTIVNVMVLGTRGSTLRPFCGVGLFLVLLIAANVFLDEILRPMYLLLSTSSERITYSRL